MPIRFQRSDETDAFYKGKPGTWLPVVIDGEHTARVTCPKCGQPGSLADHQIMRDGAVRPSVVCPHECVFHDWIRLEGWSDVDWSQAPPG